jgi:acetyl-CoA synthetase
VRLADLARPTVHSWAEAEAAFTWDPPPTYNIAADCLGAAPEHTALVVVEGDGAQSIPVARLDELSRRFATLLTGCGVRRGDRVAVKLPQSAEMAIAILGTLRVGAIVVPVSNVLGDDAILHRLTDSGATVLVCAGNDREEAIAASTGAAVVATGAADRGWADGGLDGYQPFADAVATGPDDPALLLYTSGTTGKSKGVLQGHRVLLGHHAVDLAWDHVRPGDVAYSPVDWAWAGGLLLGLLVPLAHGMTVVAYRDSRFDAERTLAIMRAHGVSVGLFPPTALRLLQRSGKLTPETMGTLRLRCLITGAEAVEPELSAWARDALGLSVNNAFGQTEANALIGHAHVLGDLDPACLGRPYPGHTVAILDAEGHPVPPGEVGEIAVRADDPVCMLRYWNNPEATDGKLRDGWLLTGDSAHADADGNLFFHGRSDDMIKSGGYRLGPAEIEAALLVNPAVHECAVVGLPDPERGQVVTAFVILAAGADGTPELTSDLQAGVRSRVGAHAYPRTVHYLSALARTSTGKVDRGALRLRATAAEETAP